MWVQIYPNIGLSSVCNNQRPHTICPVWSDVMWRQVCCCHSCGVTVDLMWGGLTAAETCQGKKSFLCVKKRSSCSVFVFVFPALHPGVWRHHRHPAHPGRAALHQGQQRGQKSAHLHHILRFGIMYAAANNLRDKVASFRSPSADERKRTL